MSAATSSPRPLRDRVLWLLLGHGGWVDVAVLAQQARVDEVKRLLETTSLPLERIADQTGYRSVQVLRAQFKRALGTSPKAYRALFVAA